MVYEGQTSNGHWRMSSSVVYVVVCNTHMQRDLLGGSMRRASSVTYPQGDTL